MVYFNLVGKMLVDKYQIKQTQIISWQILLYFVDFHCAILPLFDKRRIYRIPLKAYDKFRVENREKFSRELYRLKRAGFVRKYIDEKGEYLELTNKGRVLAKKVLVKEIEIKIPKRWDKKWRVVIFDIPDKKTGARNVLRQKLENIGFKKIQESVYVFPYECFEEINLIREIYSVKPYVQYMIVDRIETEIDLLKSFYDSNLIQKNSI